ncbi:restriction endonuclease subunit S [Candidatus Kuenenbacteria bacterium]|nr:restriction endonuclease subunit S [Candidatus Kuenenbacteria bacterium]
MKTNWQTKKLGEVCMVVGGGTPKTQVLEYWKNEIAWITPKDLGKIQDGKIDESAKMISQEGLEKSSAKLLPIGSVVLSSRAPIGYVAISEVEIATNQGCRSFICGKDVYNKYLYYFLKFNTELLNKLGGGATFREISGSTLKQIPIPLPPLPEQHRIVKILDEVFADVAKAKENAEKNLQNAKELFESYLQSVFANPGKDWEEKRIGEVLQKTETIDPTKKPNEEFIYLDVSSVNKDTKQIENATLLVGKNAPSRARKLVKTNDVIFATVRPTHSRVALISEEYNNQVCSTGYFVLRAKDFLNNNLIYYFLLTHGFNKQMEKMQKGASYPAVNDGEVKNIFITFPKSLTEQKAIVTKLDILSAKTQKLETIYKQKLSDLEELKKAVLKKAFKGEL